MGLNLQRGDMYGFVTHTWNTVKGECSHDCSYCYMKRFKNQKPIRFDEKELNTDLGRDNYIFVGSSNDMWAEDVPTKWILKTLEHINKHPDNTYLFQTKNPIRFDEFLELMPDNRILCTTLESTNEYRDISKAPTMEERRSWMSHYQKKGEKIMITIEPILDFDLKDMLWAIASIKPTWINIGADSGGHELPEPSKEKVDQLIAVLQDKYNLNLKKNLGRLLK